MRIFIAIRLGQNIEKYIENMSVTLSEYFLKARYTLPENYHITLKYIGEINRLEYNKIIKAVKETTASFNEFKITSAGPGSFKKMNKYIVYCSLAESEELTILHKTLCENLRKSGIDIETETYTPHITVARDVVLKNLFSDQQWEPVTIGVDSISIMESTRVNGKLTYIPRYSSSIRRT